MSAKKGSVRIELTPEQQELVHKATGKDAQVLELDVEELDITPDEAGRADAEVVRYTREFCTGRGGLYPTMMIAL